MQLRTITLAIATVAVFGALVVLFVQVRAPQEIVIPEDALSQARSRYEFTRGDAPAPAAFQADRSEVASRPSRRPAGERPDRPGVPAVPPARERLAPGRLPGRGAPNLPANHPDDASPVLVQKRESVREAYDMGDFESSLTQAEEFLRQDASNAYVKRVAVVSACALGDEAAARRHFEGMNTRDQRVVTKRCKRFGVRL